MIQLGPADPSQIAQFALNPGLPRLYANGLVVGVTPYDFVLTLVCNGQPMCVLNIAPNMVKGMIADLSTAVADWEKAAGHAIVPPNVIADKFQEAQKARAAQQSHATK